MRRFLIVLAAVIAGSVVLCGAGLALFVHAMMQADSYPTFMAAYHLNGSRSYDEAKRTFSDFIAKTFPTGSDANDAIAQITKGGGFQVARSSSEIVLAWKRHSGPCSEQYSIIISEDADGRIAKIVGQLRPICL
jgi:hypothetical protein